MRLYGALSRLDIDARFVILLAALTIGSVGLEVFWPSPAAAATKTVIVTMTDKPARYHPGDLKIPVGTTVDWKNTAKTLHDVNTVAADARNKNDVHLPPGAKPFDSGFLRPGQSFKYRFTVPGDYTYFCLPHEKDGMVGHIDVTG
jgi:plastocyanin